MHGVRAGLPGGVEKPVDQEIALRWSGGADMDGVVGRADVRGRAIGVGIHRDRLDALFMTGANDPERDLSAIGDKNTIHRGWVRACRRAGARLRRA